METSGPSSYMCPVCDLRFETSIQAEQCANQHFGSDTNVVFSCNVCAKTFPTIVEAFGCQCTSLSETPQNDTISSKESSQKVPLIWTTEMTHKLLEKVLSLKSKLRDKTTKKITHWREIAEGVSLLGTQITAIQAKKKFSYTEQQYKKFISHQNRTGRGRVKKPEFFNELEEIFCDNHCVNPQFTAEAGLNQEQSFSQDTQQAEEEDEEEEDRENHISEPPAKKDRRIRPKSKNDEVIAALQSLSQQAKRIGDIYEAMHESRQNYQEKSLAMQSTYLQILCDKTNGNKI